MGLADDIRDLANLGPDFDDIIDKVKNLNQSLAAGDKVTTQQITSIRSISKEYSNLYQQVEKVIEGTAKTNTLNSKANALAGRAREMAAKENDLRNKALTVNSRLAKKLKEQADYIAMAKDAAYEQSLAYKKLADFNDELNKKTGFFDGIAGLTKNIPGLQGLSSNFEAVSKTIRAVATQTGDISKGLQAGWMALAKIVGAMLVKALFDVNHEMAQFQKTLNLSKMEAMGAKLEFAAMASVTNDIAVNSKNIAEANALINKRLGTNAIYSREMLATTAKLTEKVGLSAEATGGLSELALLSGKSFRKVEESALASSYALQRSAGIGLDMKTIMEEAGKVTGVVRANLKANPDLIFAAVTKAKLLGATLEEMSRAGRTLLNFEESINAELEAELLTGRQLNLEKARAAALAGDELTLMDELGAQFGSHAEFMDMNVLQREKLAAAVGLESGKLADMLLMQEAQGKSRRELIALGGEELADRVEVLSAQEKIAAATQKFTIFLGELMTFLSPIAELVGFIAEAFGSLPGKIAIAAVLMGKLLVLYRQGAIFSMIGTIAKAFGSLPPPFNIAAGLATVAALGVATAKVTGLVKADDMMYGNNMLVTKNKGAIALNNNDTVIAGTNLGGIGRSRRDDGEPGWLGKLIRGINSKKVVYDSYDSAGPQAMQNSVDRRENNLFA